MNKALEDYVGQIKELEEENEQLKEENKRLKKEIEQLVNFTNESIKDLINNGVLKAM